MKIFKDGELQEFALFAEASGLPVGLIYQALYDETDPLQLRLDGSELNRAKYTALWNYVSKHSSVLKTEAEWQEIAAADNGVCRFFSSGNDSTTFRLPKYPDSKILTNKPDYVVQAYGYLSKDGALDINQIETVIDTKIQENNVTISSDIAGAKESVLNTVDSQYLKLSGGTLNGTITAPKFITTTGIEIY